METTNRLRRPDRLKIFGRSYLDLYLNQTNKQQARAAHLFVHFFSGRCFTRLQRETS